jgi:hypothetical protein
MVRIKNWVSCVPEDLRLTKDKLTVAGADIGTLAEFTQVVKPRRVASPFLRGISGPGKLGPFGDKKLRASKGGGDDDDEGDDGEEDAGGTSAGQGAGRSKGKSIGPSVLATPMGPGPFDLPPQASTSGAPFVPTVATPSASAANVTPHPNPLQSFPSSNGGNLTIPPHLQQQQPPKSFSQLQTSPAPLATPSTPQLQSNTIQPQAYQSRPPPQHHFQSQQSSHYLNPNQLQPAYPSHSHPQPQLNGTPLSMARPTPSSGGGNGMMRPPMGLVKGPKKLIDRSVVANAGGANHVQQVGAMEVLSDATGTLSVSALHGSPALLLPAESFLDVPAFSLHPLAPFLSLPLASQSLASIAIQPLLNSSGSPPLRSPSLPTQSRPTPRNTSPSWLPNKRIRLLLPKRLRRRLGKRLR